MSLSSINASVIKEEQKSVENDKNTLKVTFIDKNDNEQNPESKVTPANTNEKILFDNQIEVKSKLKTKELEISGVSFSVEKKLINNNTEDKAKETDTFVKEIEVIFNSDNELLKKDPALSKKVGEILKNYSAIGNENTLKAEYNQNFKDLLYSLQKGYSQNVEIIYIRLKNLEGTRNLISNVEQKISDIREKIQTLPKDNEVKTIMEAFMADYDKINSVKGLKSQYAYRINNFIKDFSKIDLSNTKDTDLNTLKKAYNSFNSELTGKKINDTITKVENNITIIQDKINNMSDDNPEKSLLQKTIDKITANLKINISLSENYSMGISTIINDLNNNKSIKQICTELLEKESNQDVKKEVSDKVSKNLENDYKLLEANAGINKNDLVTTINKLGQKGLAVSTIITKITKDANYQLSNLDVKNLKAYFQEIKNSGIKLSTSEEALLDKISTLGSKMEEIELKISSTYTAYQRSVDKIGNNIAAIKNKLMDTAEFDGPTRDYLISIISLYEKNKDNPEFKLIFSAFFENLADKLTAKSPNIEDIKNLARNFISFETTKDKDGREHIKTDAKGCPIIKKDCDLLKLEEIINSNLSPEQKESKLKEIFGRISKNSENKEFLSYLFSHETAMAMLHSNDATASAPTNQSSGGVDSKKPYVEGTSQQGGGKTSPTATGQGQGGGTGFLGRLIKLSVDMSKEEAEKMNTSINNLKRADVERVTTFLKPELTELKQSYQEAHKEEKELNYLFKEAEKINNELKNELKSPEFSRLTERVHFIMEDINKDLENNQLSLNKMEESLQETIRNAEKLEDLLELRVEPTSVKISDLLKRFRAIISELDLKVRSLNQNMFIKIQMDRDFQDDLKEVRDKAKQLDKVKLEMEKLFKESKEVKFSFLSSIGKNAQFEKGLPNLALVLQEFLSLK